MFKSILAPIIGVILFIVFVGLLYQGKMPFITAFKKTTGDKPVDELNADMSSSFRRIPRQYGREDVINNNQKSVTINNKEIKVEVAKTNEERAKGLSGRDSLEADSGMLFIFNNQKPIFWMKDTKVALDIIWINDLKIVGINKDVQPEPGVSEDKLKKYPAPEEIDLVLEVSAGYSDKNNIKVGDNVELNNI